MTQIYTLKSLLGLDYSLSSTAISEQGSLVANNFSFDKGNLSKRPGYTAIGTNASTSVIGVGEHISLNGTKIPIRLTSGAGGNLWQYTGSSWSKVNFTGDLSDQLTGTEQYSLCTGEAAGTQYVVFCDGADNIMYWSGTGLYAQLVASKARYLVNFADRIIGGYVDTIPTRIKWSTTTMTTWTGTGSGTNDFDQTPDIITNLSVLNNALVIYKERSIWVGHRTGDVNNPFYFTSISKNSGLYFPFSLIDLGTYHFIVGEDDIYFFNGVELKPIGGKIRREFFKTINKSASRIVCGTYVNTLNTILLFIPEYTVSTNTVCWVFNLDNMEWTKYITTHNISCVGQATFSSTGGMTWDQEVGTWNQATDTWDDVGSTRVDEMFGTTNGYVMYWNEESFSDNGTAFYTQWESKDFDFSLPTRMKQVLRILIGYMSSSGISCTVSISTDEGILWTDVTKTLVSTGNATVKSYFDFSISGQKVRLKVYTNSNTQDFKLVDITAVIADMGEYLG